MPNYALSKHQKMKPKHSHPSYEDAQEQYAALGIDTEQVLEEMQDFHLGLPCWPTDDVEALRHELLEAIHQLPGKHRVSLDLSCLEQVEDWIRWSREHRIKLDFDAIDTPTQQASTLTLAHPINQIRTYWIEALRRCREKANAIGAAQQSPCVVNIHINDASTEPTVERSLYRDLLGESLDQIFDRKYRWMRDSLMPRCSNTRRDARGSGTEDFCFGYAVANRKMLTLDTGYCAADATKMADKVSAMLCHVPGVVLVLGDDPMPEVFDEVVRSGAMRRVHFVLDGAARSGRRAETLVARGRAAQQCMLRALLEPTSLLHGYEINGMRDEELVLMERCKALPWSRIFEEFCQRES